MSEKGGTLFLIAIVVVLAGLLLTVMRPMFETALWSINTFFDEMLWSTSLEYPE